MEFGEKWTSLVAEKDSLYKSQWRCVAQSCHISISVLYPTGREAMQRCDTIKSGPVVHGVSFVRESNKNTQV